MLKFFRGWKRKVGCVALVLACVFLVVRTRKVTALLQALEVPARDPEIKESARMDKNHFLIELSSSERTSFGRIDFAAQTEDQKVFSAIWELESQVNNGGFDQYFRNSQSDEIGFAPTALRRIGALQCASIVERSIQIIAPLPLTDDGRFRVLEAPEKTDRERLNSLTSEFLQYPDNLTDLLFEFVSQHPATFGQVKTE